MKLTSRLKKYGSSLFLLVPYKIIRENKIKINDLIEYDILKINNLNIKNTKVSKYLCLNKECRYSFESNEKYPSCPRCDCNKIEVLV